VNNPFMVSASEGGRGAALRTAGGLDAAAAAGGLRGLNRASSAASSMGLPPFSEITIPPSPSPSVARSTFSYPETPNFSEGGTSAMDPELLERLERLEMALVEEKKARANVEQRLQKIKEDDEVQVRQVSSTLCTRSVPTAKGTKKSVLKSGGRPGNGGSNRDAVAALKCGGQVTFASIHSKPTTNKGASKRESFR